MSDGLHVDVETRSAADLKKVGAHVYFADPSTDLWCAAWSIGLGGVSVWRPGDACPPAVAEHIRAGRLVHAWNAAFERLAFSSLLGPRYGWPVPGDTQYRCTMAEALAMSLPGGLEQAAEALQLSAKKDTEGHRLMMQMARPRRRNEDGTFVWWNDETRHKRLCDYCAQDVVTEVEAGTRVRPLSAFEQQVWQLDILINDRGVYIDRALCEQAQLVVAGAKKRLDAEMRVVTGGAVKECTQAAKLTAWLRDVHGVETDGVSKDAIVDLLDRELPPAARRALELRRDAAKSSLAKVPAMLQRSSVDGRMRGNLQYHGAGTGRWAARGAQLQNLPRPTMDEPEGAIPALMTGDAQLVEILFDNPMQCVSDCIRSMIAGEP